MGRNLLQSEMQSRALRSTTLSLVGSLALVSLTFICYRLRLNLATAVLLCLIVVALLSLAGPGDSGQWVERRRHCGARRATHQCRRRVGSCCMDRFHARSANVKVGREFRRLRELGVVP